MKTHTQTHTPTTSLLRATFSIEHMFQTKSQKGDQFQCGVPGG